MVPDTCSCAAQKPAVFKPSTPASAPTTNGVPSSINPDLGDHRARSRSRRRLSAPPSALPPTRLPRCNSTWSSYRAPGAAHTHLLVTQTTTATWATSAPRASTASDKPCCAAELCYRWTTITPRVSIVCFISLHPLRVQGHGQEGAGASCAPPGCGGLRVSDGPAHTGVSAS